MYYTWEEQTLKLRVTLQPNAKQDEVVGPFEDTIKIRIQAPAQENKANQYLIALLAKWFSVPKSAITLEKGQQSRVKRLRIENPKTCPNWIERNERS